MNNTAIGQVKIVDPDHLDFTFKDVTNAVKDGIKFEALVNDEFLSKGGETLALVEEHYYLVSVNLFEKENLIIK